MNSLLNSSVKNNRTDKEPAIYRPPSSYPFLIALILLAGTAVILFTEDKKLAEELAIYAYYFLAVGVIFRFIEQHLPEPKGFSIPDRSRMNKWLNTKALKAMPETIFKIILCMLQLILKLISLSIRKMVDVIKWLYVMITRLYGVMIEAKKWMSDKLQNPRCKRTRQTGTKFQKTIAMISDTSKNIAIFLSVFLLISLVYGMVIDWQPVRRYLPNLILVIIGFLALYIFTRRSTG
ncbi:Uncharacterised protein [uncultured archaeon]|nr:Uncharacterised protein [uncultured archaeon]